MFRRIAVRRSVTMTAMKRALVFGAACLLMALPAAAKDLKIFFIDVEGGQATLIVSPSGESMLVDAGWPGSNGRDADRIAAAAKRAGISHIDYMLLTHYHVDHVGGIPAIAARLPIRHFIDHGDNTEMGSPAVGNPAEYYKIRTPEKHIIAKPGDRIPLKGVDIKVVAARGELITSALPGGGQPTPGCAETPEKEPDPTENARSVAFILTYGKFRFADLVDLTWNKELALVCPNNLLGKADVFLVNHHGLDISNAPPLLNALSPRVAIMNNGARKGGVAAAMRWIRNTPGLEDMWQLHYATQSGDANAPEQFIANMEARCEGHSIELTAREDGSFTLVNTRNGFTKEYKR